jgi:hypothetical protein
MTAIRKSKSHASVFLGIMQDCGYLPPFDTICEGDVWAICANIAMTGFEQSTIRRAAIWLGNTRDTKLGFPSTNEIVCVCWDIQLRSSGCSVFAASAEG